MALEELADDFDFETGEIDALPYTETTLTPDQKLAADGWIRMIPPLNGAFWRKGKRYLNSKHEDMPPPDTLVEHPYRGRDDGRKPQDETVVEPAEGSKQAVINTVDVGSKQAARDDLMGRTDEGQSTLSLKGSAQARPGKGKKANPKPDGNGQAE